jgi:light-regulated signal transduction histidine kinase (bacteriophytochrome)
MSAGQRPGIGQTAPVAATEPGRAAALEAEIERLEARADELERGKRALEAFAAVAAHELLETLVMTEAYTGLISERLEGHRFAASRRDLGILGRDAARVRQLVQTLLHDARSGGLREPQQRVDLPALVDECLLSLAADVAARRARVEVGPLPRVLGDRRLIGVVVMSLLSTAVLHVARGATLRVQAARRAGRWSICIHTPGPPLPNEERLTVCRYLAHRHDGHVALEATGAGSRLVFTLPPPNRRP